MNKTYDYNGLFPYSAGDLYAMDAFVEEVDGDFSGNVTEELIRRGAKWDDDAKTLTVKGMAFPVRFVKRRD